MDIVIYCLPLIIFSFFTKCYKLRALALCIASIYFVYSFLDPNEVTAWWFIFCIFGEVAVIISAIVCDHEIKHVIIKLSLFAIGCHFLRMGDYLSNHFLFYKIYPVLIQCVQIGQITAIVFAEKIRAHVWERIF